MMYLEVRPPRFRDIYVRRLLTTLLDAVLHHAELHNWRHRDVSVGNIMIFDQRGFLIDWELAQHSKLLNNAEPRVPDRTGTWQFISAGRLEDPVNARHLAMDDMESTFWVFLWLALRYGKHNLPPDALHFRLTEIFDKMGTMNGLPTGGAGKRYILMHPDAVEAIPTKFTPVAIDILLQFMRKAFGQRYRVAVKSQPSPLITAEELAEHEQLYHREFERHKKAMALLANSTYLRQRIKLSSGLDWSNDSGPNKHNISDWFHANVAVLLNKRKHFDGTSSTPLPAELSTGPALSRLAHKGEDGDSGADETRSSSKRQRIIEAVGTSEGEQSMIRADESE